VESLPDEVGRDGSIKDEKASLVNAAKQFKEIIIEAHATCIHARVQIPYTAFITPSPGLGYPKHLLNQIVASDQQIRNKLKEWITGSTSYQQLALKKMNNICSKLNNG
jgi:hypothetical protein